MTNQKYPPAGIHPVFWANIQAKRKRHLKTQIRALYRINPVLWAVVKGYDTPDKIATKLQWSPTRTTTTIERAISNHHIKRWNHKLRPVKEDHKQLQRRLLR